MLRGINVGGQKRVSMDKLVSLFESLGVRKVRTYIQSGNVVFDSVKINTTKISRKIEGVIEKSFGLTVSVLTKTKSDFERVIQNNPYLKDEKIDPSKLHVTFLFDLPNKADLKKLSDIENDIDTFNAVGNEIYLHCPNGYGRTKFTNNYFEKKLSVPATTRNWKSVISLFEIAGG